ncbi:MAG: type I restriction-modification system subunit M N-terminal domain-containing protein, partial [Desulfamplus sp.]|nr:type I restriction-modification system subunit M N-terminal domain-containing protein [Desulfamplus sp.]
MNVQGLANFIWGVADILRGDYKQASYGQVILPFTVLRRLDCVLSSTKGNVLKKYDAIRNMNMVGGDSGALGCQEIKIYW